ncbi:MAG TPA: RES family NAD+ phosphorylase [Polyangia bacterium]|nr:RES family NAD+ phosphorylase [Polyangia bacterium]
MLTGPPLLEALTHRVTSRPVPAMFFRGTPLAYAADPLGRNRGRSSPIAAGRFNLLGGTRVLYLGETHQTCAAESQAVGGASFAIAIIPVQVRLQAVIDLRDAETLDVLELEPRELALNFRLSRQPTPTQLLGEACAECGAIDGIFYASLTPAGGLCLAVLESNLRAGVTSLVVSDLRTKLADQLP